MKSHLLAGLLSLGTLLVGCDKAPPVADPPTAAMETSDPKIVDLTKRADAGDAQSQYELGEHLWPPWNDSPRWFPLGTPQSEIDKLTKADEETNAHSASAAKAIEWYQKAAAQGHAAAYFKLGQMYLNGAGVRKDPAKGVAWYRKAAELGNVDAQYALGNYFAPGDGPWNDFATPLDRSTRKEAKQAVEWYQKAAAQGHAGALFKLGEMYSNGDGVEKDEATAVEWWQKAAAQGNADAQNALGTFVLSGSGERFIPISAPNDEKRAKAIEWYSKAAAQGHAGAQASLGWMFYNGVGASKDATKAFEWYSKAAAQGDARSQFIVGMMYASGDGVVKDAATGVDWYGKAAAQGHAGAQNNLGNMYFNGEGVPKDAAKATGLYQKAAAQGSVDAQNNLALTYYSGKGAPEDKVLAYAWSNLAASKGSKPALDRRAIVETQLSMGELAEAQRLSSSWKEGQTLAREGRSSGASTASASTSGNLSKKGSGTLFLVSATGQAITNNHVVAGCSEIRIEGRDGVAKVVTQDVVNDLALVQIPGEAKAPPAAMTSDAGKLRQGDDIVVYGFPLETVLSSGGNLTPGVVSALTGLGNNTNQIQITAPIQPGSSGSPVLNKKGEVVGVVSMKLSDSAMAKATGQVGQNVNFAINGQTLRTFLDAHQVSYRSGAGFFSREKSMADLADEARTWTLVAECWK